MITQQKENFYSNVEYFMKKLDIKKTDLEKSAGVSQGYLSRFLQKEDPNNFPSVSFLDYCARKFETTIDDLLNTRFEEISPTEEFIYSFLQKLIKETAEDELIWTETPSWKIENYIKQSSDKSWDNFVLEKGLLPFNRPEEEDYYVVFLPAKDLNADLALNGSVYSTRIREDIRLHLMGTYEYDPSVPDLYSGFLLWMEQDDAPYYNQAAKLQCIARGDTNIFSTLLPSLQKLNKVIVDREKHVRIEKSFKEVMDWYLNPQEPEPEQTLSNTDINSASPDDLPF